MRILFVCLGNICRSPTAEGVLQATSSRTPASTPASTSRAPAPATGTSAIRRIGGRPLRPATRGIALGSRAQRFETFHFDDFDLILAMDRQNLADMRSLAPHAAAAGKLQLFREFDPLAVEPVTSRFPIPTSAARTASTRSST